MLALNREGMLKEHRESESETIEADELSPAYSLTAIRPTWVGFLSQHCAKAFMF